MQKESLFRQKQLPTANRLTVDVVGQTSAIGINLIGDYTHADLGTGSTIKKP
ncbi:hypothetical protein ACLK1X_06715 [Escherichia coli]